MRNWILAAGLLILIPGCGGPAEDGASCAKDEDCVNRCIDAVCATPRGLGEMCAHGGQCDEGLFCASWNNVGRCSERCREDRDCEDQVCRSVFTVDGQPIQACRPEGAGGISCQQLCDFRCDDPGQACFHCKQACLCRCAGDETCAQQHAADACFHDRTMCSC